MTERYSCTRCACEFIAPPGPVCNQFNDGSCPSCGSLYVVWLTYKENFGAKRRGATSNRSRA